MNENTETPGLPGLPISDALALEGTGDTLEEGAQREAIARDNRTISEVCSMDPEALGEATDKASPLWRLILALRSDRERHAKAEAATASGERVKRPGAVKMPKASSTSANIGDLDL